jgi:transcriptional regulator with XRE-family HTH domain
MNVTIVSNFNSAKLKLFRESRLWTQSFLADRIGVSVFTLNRWENGSQVPMREYLGKIADALDVDESDLVITE